PSMVPSALQVRCRSFLGSWWRGARWFGRGGTREVGLGGLAEGREQAVVVAGAGRQHDVTRIDAVQGDRGEVGAEAGAGRDDGYGLPTGDEFEFVLEGFDEGTVGCRASVGSGSMRQKAFQAGSGSRGRGSSAMSSRVTDSLPARRWSRGTSSTRGSS